MKKCSRVGCAIELAGLLIVLLPIFEAQACYQGWGIVGHSGQVRSSVTKRGKSSAYFLARNKARQDWIATIEKYYGEGFSHWEYACNKKYYCYFGNDWGKTYYACDVTADPGTYYTYHYMTKFKNPKPYGAGS